VSFLVTKNNKTFKLKDIPSLDINTFRDQIIKECKNNKRIVSFFCEKLEKFVILYAILASDEESKLYISSTLFKNEKSYPSITQEIQSFHLFEREFYEETGILPENHPFLKPVRYSKDRFDQNQKIEDYPFFKIEGKSIHEVGVGPVHAGIIEPGHFRFNCHGENIDHLEIQLGYQHRNIEKLFIQNQSSFYNLMILAESIAGDSTIANGLAFTHSIEALTNTNISRKSQSIRGIALELERSAMHIGDLSAICGDVAFLFGNSVFGAIRTLVINTLLKICGNRFGKGLLRVGGVNYDIDTNLNQEIKKTLNKVSKDVAGIADIMFSSPSVCERLEKTGIVDFDTAKKIGLVGMAGRASGINYDVRYNHPFGIYNYYPLYVLKLEGGDVFARSYIRYMEIMHSINFILEQLDSFPDYDLMTKEVGSIAKDSMVVSMVEGFRGEIVHSVITDNKGNICRYKIKDPSFNNWFGLAMAVRDNEISDFPLCNKSFNLSYCGFDL